MSKPLTRAEYAKRAVPCCGRKPIIYMRGRYQFCARCNRAYDLDTGAPVGNWAWKLVAGDWVSTYPDHDYAKLPGREVTR